MITKKRKISQIPEIYKLSQTSKLLVVDNGFSAIISAGNIVAGISTISIDHINSLDNPHNVTKAQVGLGNVNNTSDLNKPLSTAAILALGSKQDLLISGGNIKTINGQSLLGSGDLIFTNAVNSVNGQVGNVTLTTDNIPEGAQKYFDESLVAAYSDGVYVKLSNSYNNPSFINSLDFNKLINKPNNLSGYGITDPILFSSGTYYNPAWITGLSWSKLIDLPAFVQSLNDLIDVQINTLTIGQVLKWDGTKWTNDSNDPINELSFLDDVLLSGLGTNDVLQYNGTKWTNTPLSDIAKWGGIAGDLEDQTDLQNALNAKEPTISSGLTTDYYRGDKTFAPLNKTAVGLANVDNTSDLNKPISTATQTALNNQETLSIAYAIALS